ncbi:MAG: phage holin family protein [Candidatus Marinimicrobia bacterium]|nr:phage holin family protein [Candidatus Neomarinimicrobiota bacterium]
MVRRNRSLLARLIITMIALLVTAQVVPGIHVSGIGAGLFAAAILGIVNVILKPILIIFTIPITLFTFGIFLFIINGLMLWITSEIVPGFWISSLGAAVIGSIVLSIVNWLINSILEENRRY